MTNWKSFVPALIPFAAYGLSHFGLWPEYMPLPPLEQVWPILFGLFGVGWYSKDKDVTGGTRDQ